MIARISDILTGSIHFRSLSVRARVDFPTPSGHSKTINLPTSDLLSTALNMRQLNLHN